MSQVDTLIGMLSLTALVFVSAGMTSLRSAGDGSEPPIPRFADAAAAFEVALSGGTAAFGDLDGDGRPDLLVDGVLWWNRDGTRFTRHAAPGAGLLVDLDNDGVGDVVTLSPPAVHFGSIVGGEAGVSFETVPVDNVPASVCLGACAADLDGDGLLDLVFGGYENWNDQVTYPDLVFRQVAPRSFRCEVVSRDRRARGTTAADFDEDGDPDVYVSNYRLQPNTLLVNQGDGRLVDEAATRGALATSQGFGGGHSIGACWGDFDADGHLDLFAGNFAHVDSRGDQPKSRVLLNDGAGRFVDLGERGVWYQESYASPAAGDIDNDGRLDLFFTTVYATASFDRPNHAVLFRNELVETEDGVVVDDVGWFLRDRTEGSGLAGLPPTYQAAFADVDGDGRLDLVTAGRLFRNETDRQDRHWLNVRLVGDGVVVNRPAIGAQVRVRLADGRTIAREVQCGTGQGNADGPILHLGLGGFAGPVDLDIRWPGRNGGRLQRIEAVEVDRLVTVEFEAGR